MSTGYVLKSTKPDGPVFEIVQYNAETKIGILRGAMGVDFTESLDKERLKKWGYRVEPKPTETNHAES